METFRKPDAYKSLNSSSIMLNQEVEENVFVNDTSTIFYDIVDNLKKLIVGENN